MLLRQFLDWLSWIQEIAVLSFFHFEGGFSPHFPEVRSTQAYWEGRLPCFWWGERPRETVEKQGWGEAGNGFPGKNLVSGKFIGCHFVFLLLISYKVIAERENLLREPNDGWRFSSLFFFSYNLAQALTAIHRKVSQGCFLNSWYCLFWETVWEDHRFQHRQTWCGSERKKWGTNHEENAQGLGLLKGSYRTVFGEDGVGLVKFMVSIQFLLSIYVVLSLETAGRRVASWVWCQARICVVLWQQLLKILNE